MPGPPAPEAPISAAVAAAPARGRPDGVAKLQPTEGAPARGARGFVAGVLVLTALFGGAVVAANVAVDPRAEWGTPLGYTPLVVPDPYQHKFDLYRALDPPPAFVVLGASRASAMDPDDWPGVAPGTGVNLALSGAGGADVEVVLSYLLADDDHLQTLVLDLDAFSLLEGRRTTVVDSTAYDDLTGHPAPAPSVPGRLLRAASGSYVRDSVKVLELTYVTGYDEPRFTFDADGVRHEPANDRAKANGTFDLEAVVADQYNDADLAIFAGQNRPFDEPLAKVFIRHLEGALARGVNVTLLYPPYAPAAQERLAALPDPYERVGQGITLFDDLCAKGLHLFDYSTGAGLGLDPEGFYDGHHMTVETSARVLRALAAGQGDLCAAGGAAGGQRYAGAGRGSLIMPAGP